MKPSSWQPAKHEDIDEESLMRSLADNGDEDAIPVAEFEEQLIEVCQDHPDLSMCFSVYSQARGRIRDKLRPRGFLATHRHRSRRSQRQRPREGQKRSWQETSIPGRSHCQLTLSSLWIIRDIGAKNALSATVNPPGSN